MTRARLTLAIAFGALAFAGCGGGGDGGGDECNVATDPNCGAPSNNQAPIAKANGPYASVAGAAVSLTANGSYDPDGTTLSYAWTFGDNTSGTGAQVSHAYTAAGNYTATLTVTDAGGKTATSTAPVVVTAPTGGSASAGTLGIVLTDAPFPFDAVQSANVFVVRIDGQTTEPTDAQAAAGIAESANTDPAAGWVTVVKPNTAINLLELQGGLVKNVGQRDGIRAGSYAGFRIIIDPTQSNITLKDGSRPTVQWPAATAFGVKIVPTAPVVVPANGAVNALIDFDLGRSFDLVGATPAAGFRATPSLRTVASSQTASHVGRILVNNTPAPGVTVELLTAGTAATDFSRDRIVGTATTNEQGVFFLVNVAPGNYVRRFTFPSRYNVDAVASDITITTAAGVSASRATIEFNSTR